MSSLDQSQQDIQKNRENCQKILSLSPKIRYVGILNQFGRTLAGQLRKGVVPLFKADEARNENFIEATRNQLRKNFESLIGKTEYTFTVNEKVKILALSNETSLYYITLDKDIAAADVAKVIESARKLVSQ
jgi:hypothetical protein